MVMEIPDNFDAVCLHINDRYATSFLSKRTYPLLSPTLQPTFKNVSVTFKQDLVSLFCRHALHKVVTCNILTLLNLKSTGKMLLFTKILIVRESKQLNSITIFALYNLDLQQKKNNKEKAFDIV